MTSHSPSNVESLRAEIASAAARMIAEDGADYGSAKRKAASQILGGGKISGDFLPDNAQIEDEVRLYNQLFFGETQPARLSLLRKLALQLMQELAPFNPYLTGAVLNGTAGEHSDIHLQLFAESPKEVEIYLVNKNINFEVSEVAHFKNRSEPVERLSFMWRNEGVHLALYELDDLRGAVKQAVAGRMERAGIDAVRVLTQGDD
ncbi:hypothetical protein BH11PSE11_BH11PSE11_01160 [soil metagenome]